MGSLLDAAGASPAATEDEASLSPDQHESQHDAAVAPGAVEAENEAPDTEDQEGQQPDAPEADDADRLRELLAERDRELREQSERMARLEGRFEAHQAITSAKPAEPEPDPYEFLDDPKFNERFEDDPAGTMRDALRKAAAAAEKRAYERAHRELGSVQEYVRELDPTYKQVRETMTELEGQDWYRALPDEQKDGVALGFIRARESAAKANGTAVKVNGKQPKPVAAGASQRRAVEPKQKPDIVDQHRRLFERLGGIETGNRKHTLLG